MWCNSVKKYTCPRTIIIPYIIPFFDSLFVAFEVTFLTSDKQNAGTTQNAWIVLEGEERKYQEYSVLKACSIYENFDLETSFNKESENISEDFEKIEKRVAHGWKFNALWDMQ